ncbi:MAG: STAS domain-containing protein [Gammaproteobacteria bacterium]|nr:STAS domain-containing protein [Gammaproteobacteria bacterium]
MKEIFWLLGLPVDVLTLDEAVGRVRSGRDRLVVNFLAGRANRAPQIMQRLGLEALANSGRAGVVEALPVRWLVAGTIVRLLRGAAVVLRLWTKACSAWKPWLPRPHARLRLSGRLDRDSLPQLRESLGELTAGSRLEIDVSGLEYIDASAMGYLYALRFRHPREFGSRVRPRPGDLPLASGRCLLGRPPGSKS